MSMELAHRSAAGVAARYAKQHPLHVKVHEKLAAAGDDCDLVDAAIGNKSWTTPYCLGCDSYVDVAIRFGVDACVICLNCISAAAQEHKLCPPCDHEDLEDQWERRRYALLQAAVSVKAACLAFGRGASNLDAVETVEDILAVIEHREKP